MKERHCSTIITQWYCGGGGGGGCDSVVGVIPIETREFVWPFITAVSPSILTRSLQKIHTI